MYKKVAATSILVLIAFVFLFLSVLRSSKIKYEFDEIPAIQRVIRSDNAKIEINYPLLYPGSILPNSVLWPLKVTRDKLWLLVTTDELKKAEVSLLLADKRLASVQEIINTQDFQLVLETLQKAEMYLEKAYLEEEKARSKGADTSQFLKKYIYATLKHRQILEETLSQAPENAKPLIVRILDIPKTLYQDTKKSLMQEGQTFPENPFEG